ncbi:MAG: hypothetical protein PHN57_05925 [Candidatus Omnitrophica bacterium]|nr:hypothetical protein [Candidatus Omnitrophota bacterium]
MKRSNKRSAYFIHPSIQLRFITMTVLPTFLMSIFCIYFLFASGERTMKNEKLRLAKETALLKDTLQKIESAQGGLDSARKNAILKHDVQILQYNLEKQYFKDLGDWIDVKLTLLIIMPLILMCVGIMALLYSHRIAGPLSRMGKCMDMLAQGKYIPAISFRKYDEFKEVGEAFERLREKLEKKGLIHG